MKTRRVQVLMEEERYARLEAAAARRGVSVAELIREGVDMVAPDVRSERRAALDHLLSLPPMAGRMPDPDELHEELEQLRYGGL